MAKTTATSDNSVTKKEVIKKLLSIAFVLTLALSLTACGESSPDGSNSAKKSSGGVLSSSKKMSKEDGVGKLMEISEKLMNGDITEEEAEELYEEIKSNMETTEEALKKANNNISSFDGLPSWAKSLGMKEPDGLTLSEEESTITEPGGGFFEGFVATYKGDKEKIFSEARKITADLGLNADFDMAEVYMSSGDVDKYSVSVSVADGGNGMLLIYSATDLTAQAKFKEENL